MSLRSFLSSVRLHLVLGLAAAAFLLAASPAQAQQRSFIPPGTNSGFAADGQFVITSELSAALRKPSNSPWHIFLQPSLDYFIAQHISIGGLFLLDGDKNGARWGLGARAGYSIALGDRVNFWPSVMIKGIRAGGNTSTELWLNGPFLFQLVPHFFVGGGPYIFTQMSGGDGSEFGLQSVIGGYF